MDGRPPKRQRRSVNSSTSEQSASIGVKQTNLPSCPKPRARPSQAPAPRVSSSPSPKKPRSSPNTKSKSLHSFFQPATEGQRWSSQKFEPKRSLPTGSEATLDADVIEDDYDSYDEIFTQHLASAKTDSVVETKVKDELKARRPASKQSSRPRKPTSKRFLMPTGNSTRSPSPAQSVEEDKRPWAQRFAPSNLDEIAVHKRKVSDVQNWLEDAFSGRRRERLLVLRGPAGSGKTTTINLLSESAGFDVVEWRNPAVSEFNAQDFVSVSAQFEEFLGRGDRFGGLDLEDFSESKSTRNTHPGNRRILLVEEFPTMLSRSSSSLTAFRTSLQRYLASAAENAGGLHPPIVMVVSETASVAGPALYNHPNTTILDFNVIAPTFMQKALRSILDKEAKASQRSRIPGPAVLNKISEIGDIRSAISSLEFLCLKGDQAGTWSGSVAKTKKARGDTALTPMEEESLKLISQREASLGMFHAVGKIVYNKRPDPSLMSSDATIPPSPPDHLYIHRRPNVSQVAVNDLMDETGTDISTFICALHENYPPSCDGDTFTNDLNECIEALSDSDILSADHRPQGRRSGTGIGANLLNAGVDMLRQDEISFQVASRGLLFALPYPVNRKLTQGDGRSRCNAHKMLYPSSLRLWRKTEEIEGLLDAWMKHMLDPSNASLSPRIGSDPESTGVKSWKNLRVGHASSTDTPSTITMMSRHDALLHQLPYMTQIRPDSGQLSEITRIRGSRLDDDADDAEEDDLAPLHPPQHQHATKPGSNAFGPRLQVEEEKYILSDDDIVDD
ncbi:uncharacterized protein N7477_001192 [Penicillium maclennaniae]|uniref:uncharacterized protein n=1 Tax=Penicillium maclennaniae TaxID=1343394 RepID=UPI00253F75F0|nr:uncharacterized protein N7477_001192 [Penicillium maclennaniae]KAJ5684847.1 hypothetical protein N7477_001192 [Penicillium maclennaniae]